MVTVVTRGQGTTPKAGGGEGPLWLVFVCLSVFVCFQFQQLPELSLGSILG